MSTKGAKQQPARRSSRLGAGMGTDTEAVDFAKGLNKRRRQRELAKASKRKNRGRK